MTIPIHCSFILSVSCLLFNFICFGQHNSKIKAKVNLEAQHIVVEQELTIRNHTSSGLKTLTLLDWNNSFSSNSTALAQRFEEEYSNKFYFANENELGQTLNLSIKQDTDALTFKRISADLISVDLQQEVKPHDEVKLNLSYTLKLPSDKFTRFGIDKNGNLKLDNWCILPAPILQNPNSFYSNKDLDDLYYDNTNLTIEFSYPNTHTLYTDLNSLTKHTTETTTVETISGKNRINFEIHITQNQLFSEVSTDKFTFVSNLDDKGISSAMKAVIHDKIAFYISEKLGSFPNEKLLISRSYYKRNPVYGLNQLPDFIRPFPDGFQYEIKVLKATVSKFIRQTINTNPRTDYWINTALENYLIIKYIEDNYPDMKILGNLSRLWGIRSFEIAKKDFNDQYNFLYQYMSRINLDQPLATQKDSLLKFNTNISNKNKAGLGLKFLEDYLGERTLSDAIHSFYNDNQLKPISSKSFLSNLESLTDIKSKTNAL